MIVLKNSIVVRNLTRIKVQAIHFESNAEKGQEWVEVYCEFGFIDNDFFVAYPKPETMDSVLYFKFENGMHPEKPGSMLGRCNTCNSWVFAISGACTVKDCKGVIKPFPSYNIFRNKISASAERDVFVATEKFLINTLKTEGQDFPNPNDISDVRSLIETV